MLENLRVGIFPMLAFRIELTEDGWMFYRNNKGKRLGEAKDKLEEEVEKKTKGISLSKYIDLKHFSTIRIRRISVKGSFGCQNNALTALICSSSIMIIRLIYNTLPSAEHFEVDITPIYNKSTLQLNLKLSLQFNLLIIIFISINILTKALKKKRQG